MVVAMLQIIKVPQRAHGHVPTFLDMKTKKVTPLVAMFPRAAQATVPSAVTDRAPAISHQQLQRCLNHLLSCIS